MDIKDQLRITNQLQEIVDNQPCSLAAAVAQEALDYDAEDISTFFKNLLTYGCVSGMVSSLIYYADTAKFFDRHYVEIEDMRFQYLENGGEPLRIEGDLKNHLTWFGFEQTAQRLIDELEIDLREVYFLSEQKLLRRMGFRVVGGLGFSWFFRGVLGCDILRRIGPALQGKNALGRSQRYLARKGPGPLDRLSPVF